MTKQTFQIPEGCKAITVEQVGNQLVTTFEVEPEFKDGDVLISERVGWAIYIYRKTDKPKMGYFYCLLDSRLGLSFFDSNHYGYTPTARLATPEEAQRLWDALAKEGKRWNPETMQVESIRWRAKMGEIYYCIFGDMSIVAATECGGSTDNSRYNSGNYFQTKEQAEMARLYIQKAYNDFWKEELK